MLRRLKKDVLAQLPPKVRTRIAVATDPKMVKEIKELLNKDLSD